jgi:hypothetical protein
MSDFLTGSICLTDIPKEFITEGKNGKKYVNFAVSKRKEVSQFGETHTITVSKPKDQRKEGEGLTFIGGLKEWKGNGQQQPSNTQQTSSVAVTEDDLPF